jgi:molecular chaperone GrpE
MLPASHEPQSNPEMADKVRQTYLQHEAPAETTPSHEEPAQAGTAPHESASSSPEAEATPEAEAVDLQKQYEELHERYLRLAADFENYRKRILREREAWAETLTEQLLRHLLPLVDQLQMALEAASSSPETLRQGVELIYRNFLKLLEQLGAQPIAVTPGQPFDVYYHEAVLRLPSEFPEGHIVKELQRGYLFHDRVLRHARVAVSTGPQGEDHLSNETRSSDPEAQR